LNPEQEKKSNKEKSSPAAPKEQQVIDTKK
jgi:hypothetical protein